MFISKQVLVLLLPTKEEIKSTHCITSRHILPKISCIQTMCLQAFPNAGPQDLCNKKSA